ncbi:Arc family DNA-binding protein [Acinetobacter ursingii]|uniref:Arc family DNA-binding protein n=1 Tax=Acinetobacter ursingii TaxID=108980 RepID=UPI0030096004
MSDDQLEVVTLKVRVSPEFREQIVATAKENNRSMNQEIVSRLEDSFNPNSEMDEFIIFLEESLKEKTDNESNKILVSLLKNWLKFKKAP